MSSIDRVCYGVDEIYERHNSLIYLALEGCKKLVGKNPQKLSDLEAIQRDIYSYTSNEDCQVYLTHTNMNLAIGKRKIRLLLPYKVDEDDLGVYVVLGSQWIRPLSRDPESNKVNRLGVRCVQKTGECSQIVFSTMRMQTTLQKTLANREKTLSLGLKGQTGSVQLIDSFDYWSKKHRNLLKKGHLLPFYSGGDLRGALVSQRLSLTQKREIFKSLCHVVQKIHVLGFSHNDLKPENIFLDEAGRAFLGDFGLASDEAWVNPRGTCGYFSSEVCPRQHSFHYRERLTYYNLLVEEEKKLEEEFREEFKDFDLNDLSIFDNHPLFIFKFRELMKLKEKINQLNEALNLQGIELQEFFRTCQNKFVPQKNDICAVGFILSDLFGVVEPRVKELYNQLTDPLPEARISLDEAERAIEQIFPEAT